MLGDVVGHIVGCEMVRVFVNWSVMVDEMVCSFVNWCVMLDDMVWKFMNWCVVYWVKLSGKVNIVVPVETHL